MHVAFFFDIPERVTFQFCSNAKQPRRRRRTYRAFKGFFTFSGDRFSAGNFQSSIRQVWKRLHIQTNLSCTFSFFSLLELWRPKRIQLLMKACKKPLQWTSPRSNGRRSVILGLIGSLNGFEDEFYLGYFLKAFSIILDNLKYWNVALFPKPHFFFFRCTNLQLISSWSNKLWAKPKIEWTKRFC